MLSSETESLSGAFEHVVGLRSSFYIYSKTQSKWPQIIIGSEIMFNERRYNPLGYPIKSQSSDSK
jgi:hypothetical protein